MKEEAGGKWWEEERRHRYRESRVIEVRCEASSHAPIHPGSLKSVCVGPVETWIVEGRHVQTQRLSIEQGPQDILELLDRAAERYRVRCPRCGLTLSPGIGSARVLACGTCGENQSGVHKGRPEAATTDRALSTSPTLASRV